MRAKNRVRVTSHSLTGFDVFLSVGTLKNRSFTAFGVSRSEIGIAGRNVRTQLTQDKPDDKM